jgi:hypothetical protein
MTIAVDAIGYIATFAQADLCAVVVVLFCFLRSMRCTTYEALRPQPSHEAVPPRVLNYNPKPMDSNASSMLKTIDISTFQKRFQASCRLD